MPGDWVKRSAKAALPESAYRWLAGAKRRLTADPPLGSVSLGDLRRLTPVSRSFGMDRGQAIDRYYIERFLDAHAARIRGRVLEFGDDAYTRRFGGARVTARDVLHPTRDNPAATIVADLDRGDPVPEGEFECVVCTQMLPFVYEVRSAVRAIHRMLKSGGAVLVTAPGLSQISRYDMDRWGDYWRFTSRSLRRLFEEAFPSEGLTVDTHGNALAAVAFLEGLCAEELSPEELDHRDPDYELVITLVATKP
jgi:hypothetical protein